MKELHNHIAAIIVRYMKNKKVSIAEAILVLEMIRVDLVNQFKDQAYTKKPVIMGEKDGGV